MSISLGTKIIGDFGAEVEIAEGVVVKETLSTTIERSEEFCEVKWDNGTNTWIMKKYINNAVGKLSPIGYYTAKVYYA
jgi:hypothetical protein|tara:strand:- start:94 stop:327 length:234 start_codon:yes stop_codon:yes gene_type:complete